MDDGADPYREMEELESAASAGGPGDDADTGTSANMAPPDGPREKEAAAAAVSAAVAAASTHFSCLTDTSSQQALGQKEPIDMDADPTVTLPNIYYQCRTAKDKTFSDTACVISGGQLLGTSVGGGDGEGW